LNLRLLIVRRRYLGDLVLLDPVLRSLRAAHPGAFLALLVDEDYGSVLRDHPALDRILEIPMRRPGENPFAFFRRYLDTGRELRRLSFDTALIYQPQFRISGLLALARVPRRVGFRCHSHSRLAAPNVLVDAPLEFFARTHAVDIYYALLAPLGPVPRAEFSLPISPAAQEEADALLERLFPRRERSRKPLLLVHPGGRVACRCWPEAAFAGTLAALKEEGTAEIALTSGPGEEEESRARRIAAQVPGGLPVAPPLPLGTFTALCHRAALYLGNDTGSMHIAAGSGARVIGLFGSQLLPVFRPYGARHIALQSPQPCPCPTPESCDPSNSYRNHCVSLIPVATVLATVRQCLGEGAPVLP